MLQTHTVRQGEDLETIARRYGHVAATIWEAPENASLRRHGREDDVLHAGDRVAIPARRRRAERVPTTRRHRFRRHGLSKRVLRLVLADEDRPLAATPYTLLVDGDRFSGETDVDGALAHDIPIDAARGTLILDDLGDEYALDLGHLDPVDEISGVQQRLANLGYGPGRIDGEPGRRTRTAIEAFQRRNGLEPTGRPDQQTTDRLRSTHGS